MGVMVMERDMAVDLVEVEKKLKASDRVIYLALVEAAEYGLACPTYLDLNEMVGYESSSSSSVAVKRLEQRGLIEVRRHQRFREVGIVLSGKWTAESRSMHTTANQIPRGANDPMPLYKALVDSGVGEERADEIASDFNKAVQYVGQIKRALALINRKRRHGSFRVVAPTDRKPYKRGKL